MQNICTMLAHISVKSCFDSDSEEIIISDDSDTETTQDLSEDGEQN
jgi:hypothetical protein